ncbi:MAG: DUF1552 domain-containing protein [Myxococcota bacterium]
MSGHRRISRRIVLSGLGGVALGLPLLESWPRSARAEGPAAPEPFAVFFRQACGVATAQVTASIGAEPERFWPRKFGALTAENVQDRALDELTSYLPQCLLVGVNKNNYPEYADPHAVGAQQGLTGRGPTADTANKAGQTEADGESLDHRIGRELNADGRDSLYLYTGPESGWLGGACISYRSSGERRAALRNPLNAYQVITGGTGDLPAEVADQVARGQKSVNDLVRTQLKALMSRSTTSVADRQRLDLHLTSVRELEVNLACRLEQEQLRQLETGSSVFESIEHEDVIATTQLHAKLAALAVACGHTRSVCIQVGDGNSGTLRFRNPETGALMDNFHFISHRVTSDASEGNAIAGSDVLHHYIDRYHARMFRDLLDALSVHQLPGGTSLLNHGVAVWLNDQANGPAHSIKNVPFLLCGSANGFFKQGQYVELSGYENLCQVLNTIGTAVGLTDGNGGPLSDFGDPKLARGIRSEMLA